MNDDCHLAPMRKNLKNVCPFINFEGGFFLYTNWKGELRSTEYRLPCKFVELADKGKQTAAYVPDRVLRLPFNAQQMEHAVLSNRAPDNVVALCKQNRRKDKELNWLQGRPS